MENDPNVFCFRVPRAVGQSFLYDPVNAGAVGVGQMIQWAVDIQRDWDAAPSREFASLISQSGSKTGIIEHCRPQTHRKLAHRAHGVLSQSLGLFKTILEFRTGTIPQLFDITEF